MALVLSGDAGITFPSGSGTQAAQSKVLQVVNATYSTSTSSTSASWVSTGLTATITPLFSTSKIFVIATCAFQNSNSSNGVLATIFRGTTSGTNLGNSSEGFGNISATGQLILPTTLSVLDSPATTSSTTYTLAFYVRGGPTGYAQNGSAPSQMTLMEIAA